ncbi:MAG: hypothetical protein RL235_1154, partial [Chlamydiota bacterium]
IPHDDPSLLFINAGMNQFKDVFLGSSKRDYTRATTTQKCVRVGGKHNDLDNVGHTSRHLTFFEMLGNFSFGDYFKAEAIGYAWEVATQIFGFDPNRIWVSVFRDDDEAAVLWEKHITPSRIVRFGEKENFWSMGDTGPCGPCSEMLYDRGEAFGTGANPVDDPTGERFLEFWNLVFMQYNKSASGQMTPLPKPSIDTGAGLERVVSLQMGVDSVFQTDVLRSLIAEVENVSHTAYAASIAPAFHVIADHIRTLSFAIADGVQPGPTDRGYVLRKLLRRAVRYGRQLGLDRPFMARVLPRLVSEMGADFPELKSAEARITEILTTEEEAFFRTLQRGGNLLGQVLAGARSSKKISGDEAFKLKDTYGLPIEEILLIAKDEGLFVDQGRFQELEEKAKEVSRQAQKGVSQTFDPNFFAAFAKAHPACRFVGYAHKAHSARIIGLVQSGAFTNELKEGTHGVMLLDQTPFYAEMGGQVGDQGVIHGENALFEVVQTTSPYPGVIAHEGIVKKGHFTTLASVEASVEGTRRLLIQNNHTATHLLHWALCKVLGPHIKQAGSLVDAGRLRFDFNHHKAFTKEELCGIEDLVNDKIRTDQAVTTYEIPFAEASQKGDIKQFFGEKYGNTVRVVDIDFSKELCGGTHVDRVGKIGLFKIAKESSIASGVRRIEALTGKAAEEWVRQQEALLIHAASLIKSPPAQLVEKLNALLQEQKELQASVKAFRGKELKALVQECLATQEKLGTCTFIGREVPLSGDELAPFADELLAKMLSGVIALGMQGVDKCQLLIAVSHDLVSKGITATALIKEAAPLIQGGGGGKPHMAQAGGKKPSGLLEAIEHIRRQLHAASS